MSALVYIHIPKSAGTSHREYLARVYGKNSMYWYGLHSESKHFDQDAVGSACVVGGHRPLAFYPAAYNALYTSVVRDPVERAVSFFNYRTAPPNPKYEQRWIKEQDAALAHWRAQGIDPSSMVRSIENCAEFRNDISNLQCRYLSRHEATFAGVHKTLQQSNLVVGVFDQLQKFNDFHRSELSFALENNVKANLSDAGYSADILAEPGLVDLIRSLNVEDQRLYDFVRFEHGGLYTGADNVPAVRSRVPTPTPSPVQPVAHAPIEWQKVQMFSKGFLRVVPGTPTVLVLAIRNGSRQPLHFSDSAGDGCAITWQFQDHFGRDIEGLTGTLEGAHTVLPGQIGEMVVSFQVQADQVRGVNAASIEYALVEKSRRVRDEYPLSSSWAIVYMEPTN